jgi:serine/threonine protein kinase
VGTPLYVAPEMLEQNESGPASDFWALGIIIFQCLNGRTPFDADKDFEIFENIVNGKINFPSNMEEVALDLCKKLLVVDPSKRLGSGVDEDTSMDTLWAHPFFNKEKLEFSTSPLKYMMNLRKINNENDQLLPISRSHSANINDWVIVEDDETVLKEGRIIF